MSPQQPGTEVFVKLCLSCMPLLDGIEPASGMEPAQKQCHCVATQKLIMVNKDLEKQYQVRQ